MISSSSARVTLAAFYVSCLLVVCIAQSTIPHPVPLIPREAFLCCRIMTLHCQAELLALGYTEVKLSGINYPDGNTDQTEIALDHELGYIILIFGKFLNWMSSQRGMYINKCFHNTSDNQIVFVPIDKLCRAMVTNPSRRYLSRPCIKLLHNLVATTSTLLYSQTFSDGSVQKFQDNMPELVSVFLETADPERTRTFRNTIDFIISRD